MYLIFRCPSFITEQTANLHFNRNNELCTSYAQGQTNGRKLFELWQRDE